MWVFFAAASRKGIHRAGRCASERGKARGVNVIPGLFLRSAVDAVSACFDKCGRTVVSRWEDNCGLDAGVIGSWAVAGDSVIMFRLRVGMKED